MKFTEPYPELNNKKECSILKLLIAWLVGIFGGISIMILVDTAPTTNEIPDQVLKQDLTLYETGYRKGWVDALLIKDITYKDTIIYTEPKN